MGTSQKIKSNQPFHLSNETKQLTSLFEKAKQDTESEKIFSIAFRLNPNALILSLKSDGTIMEVNEGFTYLFGYSRDEIIGKSSLTLNLFAQNDDRNKLMELINGRTSLQGHEIYIRKKSGEISPVLLSAEILDIGNAEALLTTLQDISGLKKAENELKVEHSILEAVVSNIGVGFIVCDKDGNITSMNEAACKIYEFPGTYQGKISYTRIRQLVRMKSQDGKYIPYEEWPLAKSLAGQYVKDFKVTLTRCRSGTDRIISFNSTPVFSMDQLSSIVLTLTDLTDIEERTRLLNRERELFQGIVDHIPIMISIYDPQMSYFRFNEEFKNTLGWTEEDTEDGKFMERVYPDPVYRKAVSEYMKSLEFGWKEWKAMAKNGSSIDSLWANIDLSSGLQVGIGIDIRERKRTEEKLRENEQRLQGIFDNAALGIVETDGKDRFVRVNNRICQILNYERHELLGKTVTDITYPPDRPASILRNNRLHKGEVNMFTYEKRYMKKDGDPLWVRVSVSAILDYSGKYIKSIGTVEDISEARKAIEALRESEEKFRLIFENITEGVVLYELELNNNMVMNHNVLAVNPAFEKYTGLTAESLSAGACLDEEKQYFKEYYEVALSGKPFRFESYFNRIGKHLIINVISPRYGQFATVFEDITELKKIENQIKQKNDELTQFIYTVSHDLRSPLVTIKSFSEFLWEDAEKHDKASLTQDIKYIQNAAEKMGKLLDELLEISRIGRKDEPKSDIALDQVIQSALDLVAGIINSKKVRIVTKNTNIMVFGSFKRLVQVYQNLIDNAVKFMGKQCEPLIEIGTKTRKSSGELVFYVRDNGQGIDKRHQHKIFGMFEKIDTGSEGVGIGLAIVKRIIELHNGTIWVESEGPGKGTEFCFTLSNNIN